MEFLIICGSILIILLANFIYKVVLNREWFNNLKEKDVINVRIYSNFCECKRESVVTGRTSKNNIKARLTAKSYSDCVTCSNMKAISDEGENTCYYFVSEFPRNSVEKIKE